MAKEDFYIGYLPEAPKRIVRHIRLLIIVLLLLVPALAFVIVSNQSGFPTSLFEFGNYTTLTGQLIQKPVPILRINNGKDIYGNPSYQSVLLIGLGKFGVTGTIRQMERETGTSLDGQLVDLRGTLIYYDGVSLLELTEGKDALLQHRPAGNSTAASESLGAVTLRGEIVDAKCYFGVMKPGEGKPHRSCAIRCISGGVPPVLQVTNREGQSNYYLLVGANGEQVNQQVLDYVAEPVEISGQLEQLADLLILKMNAPINRLTK